MPSHSIIAVLASSVTRNLASVNCSATQIAVLNPKDSVVSLPSLINEDSLGVKFKGPTYSHFRCSLRECQKDDHLVLEEFVHTSAFFQPSPELSSCFSSDLFGINTFLPQRASAQNASGRRRCPQNNSRASPDGICGRLANCFDADDGWVDPLPL